MSIKVLCVCVHVCECADSSCHLKMIHAVTTKRQKGTVGTDQAEWTAVSWHPPSGQVRVSLPNQKL